MINSFTYLYILHLYVIFVNNYKDFFAEKADKTRFFCIFYGINTLLGVKSMKSAEMSSNLMPLYSVTA